MTRSNSEALAMPNSYAVMEQEEMMYLEGGSIAIPMRREYLSKHQCTLKGKEAFTMGSVRGMTILEIAQEIYAHAVAYYKAPLLLASGLINYWMYNKLREKAGVINLDDGGESRFGFKAAYVAIWYGIF